MPFARKRDSLLEHRDYDAMFANLLVNDREGRAMADSLIKATRLKLKRYDWVIWYLRWARLALLWHRMMEGKIEARKMAEYAHRMASIIGQPSGSVVAWMKTSQSYDGMMDQLVNLEHYRSLPIQEIMEYRPNAETPETLMRKFEDLEKKWQEGSKNLLTPQPGDRKILSVGKGLAWWRLDRAYCQKEGDAMGHCGNGGRRGSSDNILSLRQEVKQGPMTFYKPYLTFILYDDGKLGEMKGRFNKSPKNAAAAGYSPSDFQREIVALLKQPWIKGFGRRGHDPSNDFKIEDLSPELQQELLDAKPELADLRTTITDAAMMVLADLPLTYADVRDTENGEEVLWEAPVSFGWLAMRIGTKEAIREVEAAVAEGGTTSTDSPYSGVDLETRDRFAMAYRITLDANKWRQVVRQRQWKSMSSVMDAAIPTDYYERRNSFIEEGKRIIGKAMEAGERKVRVEGSPVPREVDGSVEVGSVAEAERLAIEDYESVRDAEVDAEWLYGYENDDPIEIRGPFQVKVLDTHRDEIVRWMDDNLDPEWSVQPVDESPNLDLLPDNWKSISFWMHGPSYYVPRRKQN